MVNLYNKAGRSLYFADRKEYYRRLKISKSLKEHYKRKRIISEQIKKPKKIIKEIQKKLGFTRLRRQVTYNTGYSISIRAISINGANLEELETAVHEFLNSNKELLRMDWEYIGYEKEEIDNNEDKNLKDKNIYIELNIRGNVTMEKI